MLCLDLFLNLGSLTNSVSQVVQLSASYLTVTDNVDTGYVGGMERESLFHAYTVCYAANGEGLGDTAAVTGDNSTLEHLDSFSRTLFDFVVYTDGVTNMESILGSKNKVARTFP